MIALGHWEKNILKNILNSWRARVVYSRSLYQLSISFHSHKILRETIRGWRDVVDRKIYMRVLIINLILILLFYNIIFYKIILLLLFLNINLINL